MATHRSTYAAALAAALVIPLSYLALTTLGEDSGAAARWTPGVAVLPAALAAWCYARIPLDAPRRAPLDSGGLLLRVAVLLALVLLTESTVSAIVAGYAPVAALDGPGSSPIVFHDRLSTMLGLPAGLLVLFGLGAWSARLLPVTHPFRWLTVVTVASRAIRLLLHPVASTYSRTHDLRLYGLGYTLTRTAILGVLIFCFLALGSLHGRGRRGTGLVHRRREQRRYDVEDGDPVPHPERERALD